MKTGRESALLAQIRNECETGLSFVEGTDRENFLSDQLIQHAVAMSLVAIGEYVAKLVQSSPEYARVHPEIPWGSVIGMRNRIAHGYYGLDFEVVWDTVRESIPDLLAKLPQEPAV